jgi:hypothetical protein
MSLAEGGFDGGGGVATRKNKAEVAVAFGQGDEGVVQFGGDFDAFDEGDGLGGFQTRDTFK